MSGQNLKLSVIIVSVNGLPYIGYSLKSLDQQYCRDEIEIILVDRCGDSVRNFVGQKYPTVKLIKASPETTIPKLRALAFREASADIIAVLEDHCIVESDWAQRMIEAHRSEYSVIGGSIENAACEKLVDWAAFFCDYSQAIKPLPEGQANILPGNNVSYKRLVIERFRDVIEAEVWDYTLHEHIKNAGISLYSIPSITVHHKISASLGWFISQRYHLARSFAGMRFVNASGFQRVLYGAGSVLLPVVLAKRIVTNVWKKGRYRRELFLSLPFLMLLVFSWGIGELFGYILGPGVSSSKVC
ncbi:MAG: glycosyltransferase [Sedimentisphaerales bacterium]|nr:glycosyltransferase [Sedimentisphaerales bacterium]